MPRYRNGQSLKHRVRKGAQIVSNDLYKENLRIRPTVNGKEKTDFLQQTQEVVFHLFAFCGILDDIREYGVTFLGLLPKRGLNSPTWSQTCSLPVSASKHAEIIGMHHHAQL